MAARGRPAAWPHSNVGFKSSTGGFAAAGTEACTRGRSAPATPRDVADRAGAKGPERAATDNMATTAPTRKMVGHRTTLGRRKGTGAGREGCDVSA